jgi:hypothetical protein
VVISLRLSQFPFSGKEVTAKATVFKRYLGGGATREDQSREEIGVAAKTFYLGMGPFRCAHNVRIAVTGLSSRAWLCVTASPPFCMPFIPFNGKTD